MDKEQFDQLGEKLDVLVKLVAASVVADKSLTEQVERLSAVGLSPSQIASVLGKPANTITGITSRLARRGKSGQGKQVG